MLESVTISRRQSEIREQLAVLAGKPEPSEDEVRSMTDLDKEYRRNEARYRAALIVEDEERREAGADLETREGRQWDDLVQSFELRQVALALDEGQQLDGATAEIVQELRAHGGYRGIPIPWAALEVRTGETVASGVPDPIQTRPIIDRLFPSSVAARMGAQLVNIDHGAVEWPVTTQGALVGWQDGETAAVGAAQAYQSADRPMKPDQTLGVQMKITRRSLKQSGAALEQAVRRDMSASMSVAMDQAVFLGTGANGQPLGVITGRSTYGIALDEIDAPATWAAFRAAVTAFMVANAAASPGAVRALIRPELWDFMDSQLIEGTAVTEFDRLTRHIPAANIATTSNGLAVPSGDPEATTALLTTATGGVPPMFVGVWGGIDLIRDPYSDAQSGGLRLTALATMDVTVARPAQLRVLTGLEIEAGNGEG